MQSTTGEPASSWTNRPATAVTRGMCLLVICLQLAGCGRLAYRLDNRVPEHFVPNPLELPAANDEFVWSQVIDAVDDYFRISREQPVQNSDGIMLDGRLETSYRIGASLLEPWRKDSTSGFERLQSTLQSVRRRAIVTVRPRGPSTGGQAMGGLGAGGLGAGGLGAGGPGYILEVVVQKDLEDTNRSQYATESASATRHDGTVVRLDDGFDVSPETLGWIPLGRDSSLEQVILQDIHRRITQPDRKHLFSSLTTQE